jgi:hypothetical protein
MRAGLLVGLLYALGLLIFGASPGPAEEGRLGSPRFEVATPELSRSGIRGGETAEYTFLVQNLGNADLAITSVDPSCDCTTVDFDHTVAPGKTGIILAHVHTKPLQTQLRVSLMVEANDPAERTYELRTDTTVTPAYTITPSSNQSILTPSGQDSTATFNVQFNRAEDVRWDKHVARIGPVLVHIVAVPGERNCFTITVVVSHRGVGHDVTGEVDLAPLPASIPPLHLVVERLEAESIVTAPEAVDFGWVSRGDTVVRHLIVFSRQRMFRITRAESSDPAISVQCTALPAQVGLYSVALTLTMPQIPPSPRGRVTLHTDCPDQETIDIPVQFILARRGAARITHKPGPGSTPAPNAAGTTPGPGAPTPVPPVPAH